MRLTIGIRSPSAHGCNNGPSIRDGGENPRTGDMTMRSILGLCSLGFTLAFGGAALAASVNDHASPVYRDVFLDCKTVETTISSIFIGTSRVTGMVRGGRLMPVEFASRAVANL